MPSAPRASPETYEPQGKESVMDNAGFFLGSHQPGWLAKAGVPLFISDRRLKVYKTLPVAIAPWAADSGGFTELQQYGRWTVTPADYVARLRRYRDEVGRLLWAAPQDWMCEPAVISGGRMGPLTFAGTGLSVVEHQRRTVLNFVQLRDLAPDLPVIPVVQGWEPDDYLRCADMYWTLARIDLTGFPLVGLGSVCRRQGTACAGQIITRLHTAGITRLHGFGFKTQGLAEHGRTLASADSMAWSFDARARAKTLPGHLARHKNCANCLPYALQWRTRVLTAATDAHLNL
jgi:hypothetical protein